MNSLFARVLDPAFGHPRGPLGRLGGAVMARGNAAQEHRAVIQAGLRPGEHALVVGHGPGVGLVSAASAVTSSGHVVGVDPSETMRTLAAVRCADEIAAGVVELRRGQAEDTGLPPASQDAAISVNNVMLWDEPAAFAELGRVLRPGARLVITVHRHALASTPERLRDRMIDTGFTDVTLLVRERRHNSPAVELLGRRA